MALKQKNETRLFCKEWLLTKVHTLKVILTFVLFPITLLAEHVHVQEVTLKDDPGEAGPAVVVQITFGKKTFRCLDLYDWKWATDLYGLDALAIAPQTGTGMVGVKFLTLVDANQKPVTEIKTASAILKKEWDVQVEEGKVKITNWISTDDDLTIYYRLIEETQELQCVCRYFFMEDQLIALKMLSDKKLLTVSQSIFARLNGSFSKAE